ncbi:MAG: stage V sporulation T C-terminal domain-containing protein, partial [Peptostreptococcaceae bacterium]
KVPKKDYKEKSISKELEQLIENRETKSLTDNKIVPLYKDDSGDYSSQIIMPIVSVSGDCIGSVTVVSKENETLPEGIEKMIKIASNFLGKQVQ